MALLQHRALDGLIRNATWAYPTSIGVCTRTARRPTAGPPSPSVATATANSWSIIPRQESRQQLLSCICHAESATSSTPTSGSRRVRGTIQQQQQLQEQLLQQPQQAQQQQRTEPQQRPIRVAADSTVKAVAMAVCYQLVHFGEAEVWATSSANHFTAVTALAEAHKLQQQHHNQGIVAIASLSANDQPVADDQKKGLKKLTLSVTRTDPVQKQVWECSPSAAAADPNTTPRLSMNRTKVVADIMQLLLQQLSVEADVVVECRGEQAVARALKAALSLQASQGQHMMLQPWPGQVINVVAEKKGVQGMPVKGLLLRMSWAQQHDQQQ